MTNFSMQKESILPTADTKRFMYWTKMLAEAEIPHTMKPFMDGFQICYPVESPPDRVMDAIEHYGSYGSESDLLEIMGLLTPEEREHDSVLGCLSAKDVFKRIERHWREG